MAEVQCAKIFPRNRAVIRATKSVRCLPADLSVEGHQAPAEFEAIRLATLVQPDYSQIAALLKGSLNWTVLLSLAEVHSVRLQLIRALQRLDWVGVPFEIKQSLSDFLLLHKAHSLLVASELTRVNDEFSRRAIRFATFKGPSLALQLYGDLSHRECNDIDIIVEERQVARVEAILGSLDYRAALGSSEFRSAFLSYQRQYLFVRTDNSNLAIDLHWDFAGTSVPFPVTSAEIWNNLERADIGGRLVPTLGHADLALLLVGHGAKEGWRCLGWVADFAMLIEKHSKLDWRDLLDRARRRGCNRSLLVGCLLVARLLGSRVDESLLRLAESDVAARAAAEALVNRLRNRWPAPASGRELSELDLCESRKQRARAVGSFIVTRTISDYVSMPLPRPLWRIYHLTRPFRLAGKIIATRASTRRSQIFSHVP
jgi:hypothetical protein